MDHDAAPSVAAGPQSVGTAGATDMSEDEINTVTEVMRAFTVTKSQRQGIVGRSQAVGWPDFRVRKRISQETMKPNMVHLQLRINAIIAQHFPEFTWTTLMLNDSVKCQAHRDKGNVGMSVAIVVAPVAAGPQSVGAGATTDGWLVYVDEEDNVTEVVAKPGQIAMFSGHRTHRNTDYDFKRYSIIAFHHRSFKYAPEDAQQQLVSLGYQLPATATSPSPSRASEPRGEGGEATAAEDDDDYYGEDIWADDDGTQAGASSAAVNAIESATLLIPMRDRSTMVERASLHDGECIGKGL